jgi:hypothetical protein
MQSAALTFRWSSDSDHVIENSQSFSIIARHKSLNLQTIHTNGHNTAFHSAGAQPASISLFTESSNTPKMSSKDRNALLHHLSPLCYSSWPTSKRLPPRYAEAMERTQRVYPGSSRKILLAFGADARDVGGVRAILPTSVCAPNLPLHRLLKVDTDIRIGTQYTTPSRKALSVHASVANTPSGATQPAKSAA